MREKTMTRQISGCYSHFLLKGVGSIFLFSTVLEGRFKEKRQTAKAFPSSFARLRPASANLNRGNAGRFFLR